jgi:hypothetical protein
MAKFSARRLLTAAILSLGAILAPSATAASSGSLLTPVALVTGKASPCAGRVLSQPFAPWNDPATYFPVAGGSFEGGAPGWTLGGGAAVEAGGNAFLSGGASLSLAAGASATTPSICVDLGSPTLRFFATSKTGSVTIDALVGNLAVRVGTFAPGQTWQPSQAIVYLTNALSAITATGTSFTSFRFTAVHGDVRIDDVYVDPYRRT